MQYNRNNNEQVLTIANQARSMQSNENAPYNIDEIFKKLDIEVVEKIPTHSSELELPVLERLSENFFKVYIPKSNNKPYVYYKKTIGLFMYLFNNLAIGEKMTNYDLINNKNRLNDNLAPVVCEFMIPSEDFEADLLKSFMEHGRNANLFFAKVRNKYCVPTSLIILKMMKKMDEQKKELKESGIDFEELMKASLEMDDLDDGEDKKNDGKKKEEDSDNNP